MGLDIFIESFSEREEERLSCHGISREFCFQIRELAYVDSDYKTELVQLYELYHLDYRVLSEMNVWRFEEKLRYEGVGELTKDEIDGYYQQALQPSVELLKNLQSLYQAIERNPERLKEVKWREHGRPHYLDRFNENVGNYVVDRNLGWDLRTMIDFLKQLPPSTAIRFGFI